MNLGPGRTAKAVAAGDSYTCAILDDDTIKCWGIRRRCRGRHDPDIAAWDRLTPTAADLGPGRTAKALSAGDGFACAILDDDTLKCWGVEPSVDSLGD